MPTEASSTQPTPGAPWPVRAAPLRQRLRDALPAAMKARDRTAVAALRSALSAIDNAEAVQAPPGVDRGLAIEQSPQGPGAADARRRELSEAQITEIVRSEVSDREGAARDLDRLGRADRAGQLRAEAAVLSTHL